MLLGNIEILKQIIEGNIRIVPFSLDESHRKELSKIFNEGSELQNLQYIKSVISLFPQLQSASYDISMSSNIEYVDDMYIETKNGIDVTSMLDSVKDYGYKDFINPYIDLKERNSFVDYVKKIESLTFLLKNKNESLFYKINNKDKRFVILLPFQRILVTSFESIGSLNEGITPKISSKSTFARFGCEVCSCAGFGDAGYASPWTLEIINKNRTYPILLLEDTLVAQVHFTKTLNNCTLYNKEYNQIISIENENDAKKVMLPKSLKIR